VVEADRDYARQAADAAFDEVRLLEQLLSRFIQSSDVSRISRLAPGKRTVVAPQTFDCLRVALRAQWATYGAFDISYVSGDAPNGKRLELDPSTSSVTVGDSGARIDLGGIGKGYALDRMAAVLREWDIAAALLWASSSTVLALGRPDADRPWTVRFGTRTDRRQHGLQSSALSASGTAVKGAHIVDPRTGDYAGPQRAAWAAAPSAAMADALSTAFMVMTSAQLCRCCERSTGVAGYIAASDQGSLVTYNL
jgi:thiamine biosynthesis lipoprotein